MGFSLKTSKNSLLNKTVSYTNDSLYNCKVGNWPVNNSLRPKYCPLWNLISCELSILLLFYKCNSPDSIKQRHGSIN